MKIRLLVPASLIMTRDVPYCDVDRHDESRPYYNVPAEADEHSA